MQSVRPWPYLAYGLLGLPLAMAALPIYLQVPTYYTSGLGLAVASTGWVLFLARLIDTVQDPWLGRCIDRLSSLGLKIWLTAGGLLLGWSFAGIWLPPLPLRHHSGVLLAWLGFMLMLVYLAHSMLNIAYLAWGARIASQVDGLLGASASREASGLIGALVASVVPSLILGQVTNFSLAGYVCGFALILALALAALLCAAPPWRNARTSEHPTVTGWGATWTILAHNRQFRLLLLPYFLNAVSVAIPATLALFYINDYLQAAPQAGVLLATYFLATALGLPLWVAAAKRLGVLQAWRLGMLLAILAFGGTICLQPGDIRLYALVCVAAGLALGADLALPPVLLAGVIASDESPAAYYGVWTLLGKLALALSGLALPLLAAFGYQSGVPGSVSLRWVYAVLPCLFKLVALLLSTSLGQIRAERAVNRFS